MARTVDLFEKNLRPGIFRFEDSLNESHLLMMSDGYFVASLSSNISDKYAFFDDIAMAFSFPAYFGRNWDALTDCLTDLEWLPDKPGYILLIWPNADSFYTSSETEFNTLIGVMNNAIDRWWSRKVVFWLVLDSTNNPAFELIPQIYP